MLNPNEDVKYDNSFQRYSHFDKYKYEIINLFNYFKTVTEIKVKLEENHKEKISYSSLNYYIKKFQLNKKKSNSIEEINKNECTNIKILRGKLIKYVFNWRLKKEEIDAIEANMDSLTKLYKIINLFKDFYTNFKKSLLTQDWLNLTHIIKSRYDSKVISKFIAGLKTDFQAVINSTKYPYSNGCVEGNVNKLKKIKRDMYGRAHIKLLRNKVIYQSLYF